MDPNARIDPYDNIERLRRELLERVLRSTAVFLVLMLAVVIPFSANKSGSIAVVLVEFLLGVVLPWWLVTKGRASKASLLFLIAMAIPLSVIIWFGRGVLAPAVVLQVALVVQAGMLLERKRMLVLAVYFMALDLTKVLVEQNGIQIPVAFPGTPMIGWANVALAMIWIAPVLFGATEGLERVVGRLSAQVGELQSTNERLLESEQLRNSITETAPVGIVVFDARGHSIFANSFAVARLGPEIQACNRHHLPWKVTDHTGVKFPPGLSPLDRVGRGRQALYGEAIAIERPAGRRVYLSLSAAPLSGPHDGIVVAFEDVTQRVEMERRHLHSQRLASMGQMAGYLAHDFNNFLTVIRGDSQMLLQHAASDEACLIRVQRIIKASDHAATVCRQLLSFARRDQQQAFPLSLADLLEEHESLLQTPLPSNVQLRLNLMSGLPLVEAEPSVLLQVVLNLVSNARDAMPLGGEITITTMADANSHGVVLVVEDTGTGMDEQTLRSIFEPYFTTKARGSGSGLGLAIVYGVMEQLHGWIRVESQPGQGTRFVLHFPAAPVADAAQA